MGAAFLWHTIADTTANRLGILDEEKTNLDKAAYNYTYRQRTPSSTWTRVPWMGIWSTTRFAGGDPTVSPYIGGQDMGDGAAWWEPLALSSGGSYRPGYIVGTVVDNNSNTLSGVALNLFLASTEVLVSSGVSDGLGNYMLPTPYAGQAHFIWAEYGAGTLVGGSVDTLTPNF
jgi:hypothetical protein